MRILTAFDGVFIDPEAEAAAIAERLFERVCEALRGDEVRSRALFVGLRAEIRANPAAHGWIAGERIGCFADEDPLAFEQAAARALFELGPAEVRERLRALGFDDPEALAATCQAPPPGADVPTGAPAVLEEALGAVQTLFATGAEIVIVSNSPPERIRSILEPTAILRWGTGKIRIRPGARKFQVTGDRPQDVPVEEDFAGRRVPLRRGAYFDVLNDERPDAVVGAALSTDLALPRALRERVEGFEEMDLVLVRRAATPRWALEACREKEIAVIDSLARLPALLRM